MRAMRAGFFHDVRLHRDASGTYYTSSSFGYDIWTRYLSVFDELVVVSRSQPLVDKLQKTRYAISSGNDVVFEPVPNLASLSPRNHLEARRTISRVLQGVDCAIIRLPSTIGIVACAEAIRMRKPWAVEVVGCARDALWTHGSIAGKVLALPKFLRNRHYIKNAPYVLYVTQQFLQYRYPFRGVRTTHCSDVEIATPADEVLEQRLDRIETRPNTTPMRIGMIGSLNVAYKGHETAIRTLELLNKHESDTFELRCLGEGDSSCWQELASRLGVSENIEFCGVLPSGEPVLEWLDNTDLFIIPSFTEGLPRVLVEALSRGCPAIGSTAGGIPELLDRDYLHSPGDYKHLAALVEKIAHDKDEMKRCAKVNFARSKEYAKEVLDKRRTEFWSDFRDYVANCKDEVKM